MYTPRIIALLMKTKLRPRLIYAPCILIGAVVSFLAGFVVGHAAAFAARRISEVMAPQNLASQAPHLLEITGIPDTERGTCTCRIQSERGLEFGGYGDLLQMVLRVCIQVRFRMNIL